jgi:transglutaminase-like putative cysteine protease
MRTPPILIAAGLLLWGYQTGFLIIAAVMAIALEGSRFVKARWEFTEQEYQRIWDLCALLFIGGVVIALGSEEIKLPLFAFAQWLPFIVFPIMAVQCYGAREQITLRTFFWPLRRRQSTWSEKSINISYLFLGVCIFSASAASPKTALGPQYFYFAMTLVMMIALSAVRPRRFSGAVWMTLSAVLLCSGYFAHRGLQELQAHVESAVGRWLTSFGRGEFDMRESRTSLGQIGRIKLSGKIVMRVDVESGHAPELLREASYDNFRHHVWNATAYEFSEADGDTNDVWTLLPNKPGTNIVRIATYMEKGQGILPLPRGASELRDLPVMTVATNGLGLAKVTDGPGFVHFAARFGERATLDAPHGEFDVFVPDQEREVITMLGEQLGLNESGRSVEDKLASIRNFLRDEFSYSTWITRRHVDKERKKTPLAMFLTEARSGHCEYFATATVLLARQAGIPARYAVGYAVAESTDPGKYVIRGRHAHAWTLVHHNGAWHDFDTTPGSWSEIEQQKASFWQPLSDLWSRLWFEFSKWRYAKTNYRQYLIWLLVPLILVLVWRVLAARRRKVTSDSPKEDGVHSAWPGMDSEFYLIEKRLTELGFPREPAETLRDWQTRISNSGRFAKEEIQPILLLHQRYRFDPVGIVASEREALRRNVALWLGRQQSVNAQPSTEATAQQHAE